MDLASLTIAGYPSFFLRQPRPRPLSPAFDEPFRHRPVVTYAAPEPGLCYAQLGLAPDGTVTDPCPW